MTVEKQEIRILTQKISEEKTNSFFYDGSIAHVIRPDGTTILLIANGDIRIDIDGEDFDNKTKENAIERYDLTDKKLKDLEKDGILKWGNNNWFEVIWTKDGIDSWNSFSNTVTYDYDSAIQIFKDCYNRKVMKIINDEKRIQDALKHAREVLDLYQQRRGNFVINAVIKRDIEAVEQGDYSEVAIKRLEESKYKE